MGGIRWTGFRAKVFALIGLVVLGSSVREFMHRSALETVKIDGELYAAIMKEKDLVNDLTPPTLFVRSPYILCIYLAVEDNPTKINELLSQLETSEKEYRSNYQDWMNKLPAGPVRDSLRDDTHSQAEEFFRVLRREVIPAAATLLQPGGREKMFVALRGPLREAYEKQLVACNKTARAAAAGEERQEAEARATIAWWRNAVLIVSGIILLSTIAAAWWISGGLLKSVKRLTIKMQSMAEGTGDLTARVPVNSRDEIGDLSEAANKLLEKFQALVLGIRESSIQLYATSTEIAATAREQESTMHTLGGSTNQIAAAVRQISATSSELSTTMNAVTEGGRATNKLAAAGRTGLSGMAGTMQRLADSTNSISGKLNVVRQKANDINVVVTTITKVADQTNLLSINAAIEAEKAGEYGRGFLVVAREIRRLADQTAVATLDIETMVRQMQAAVSAGVMEMDKFTEDVRAGVGRVSEINGQMTQIIEQVHGLNDRFHAVSEGMSQQSSGAKQINDAMISFVAGVQQTSASLKEFHSVTENLRDSADQLKHQVAQFKTAG